MSFTSDLAAIGRIIDAVKAYRDLTQDYRNPVDNEGVSIYLKQHVSIADWLVWQRAYGGRRVRLQADGMAYA